MQVIEVRDLRCPASRRSAGLRGVSADLPPGLTILLGPADGGTELLTACLAGHRPRAAAGAVLHPGGAPARLAFVPQGAGLSPGVTLADALEWVGLLEGKKDGESRRAEISRIAEVLGLVPWLSTLTHRLPPAALFRACLGRALLRNPEFLVVEEPPGLSPDERAASRVDIVRLARSRTIVLSVPGPEGLDKLDAGLIILKAGTVRFYGTIQSLLSAGAGHVWEVQIPRNESLEMPVGYAVGEEATGTEVVRLRVTGPVPPRPGSLPVRPSVSDVYAWALVSDEAALAAREGSETAE